MSPPFARRSPLPPDEVPGQRGHVPPVNGNGAAITADCDPSGAYHIGSDLVVHHSKSSF